MAVIEMFLVLLRQELADGNIVELGDFGSFWLKNSSEGSATADKVSAKNITNLLPRFNPGKEFKNVLKMVEFVKNNSVQVEEVS